MPEAIFSTAGLLPFMKYPHWAGVLSSIGILLFLLLWMFYHIRALRRKLLKQQIDLRFQLDRSSELDMLINRICQLGKISFFVGNLNQRKLTVSRHGDVEFHIADSYLENMLPADREVFKQNYNKLLDGEQQNFQNTFTLNINGRQRKHLVNACLFTTPETRKKKVMFIAMDITDFEDQHGQLVKADLLLKEIFDTMPGYIFLKNISSDFTYERCNPFYSALLNKTPNDMVGKNDFELFDRQLANKIRSNDMNIVRNDVTSDNRWYFHTPDGKKHAIRFIVHPLYNQESILGFGLDVTMQEHIAWKLRTRNKELRLLLSQLTEQAILVNEKQQLICASGAMQNMFKKRFGTTKDLTCSHIFNCNKYASEECGVCRALKSQQITQCDCAGDYGKLTITPLFNEEANCVDYLAISIEKKPTDNENQDELQA